MKKGKLIVISGPSGVGKSTIREKIINTYDNYWYSISMTTRLPRDGEIDGIDYYFVSKDEFLNNIKNNNFVEYAEVYEDVFYGTPKNVIDEKLSNGFNVILEIDVFGALNIKKLYPDALLIFIAPPSMEQLENRLRNRNTDDIDKVNERLNKAHKELAFKDKYNYVVINNDVDKSVLDINNFIEK